MPLLCFGNHKWYNTAIPYGVITGWKQGFPCEVFPHREKPVFITWNPCNENRLFPVRYVAFTNYVYFDHVLAMFGLSVSTIVPNYLLLIRILLTTYPTKIARVIWESSLNTHFEVIVATKGQLISKANLKIFILTKNQRNYFCIFALALKNPSKVVATKDKSTKRLIFCYLLYIFLNVTTFRG